MLLSTIFILFSHHIFGYGFVPDILIKTIDSYTTIGNIRCTDQIIGYDPEACRTTCSTVTQKQINYSNTFCVLHFGNTSLIIHLILIAQNEQYQPTKNNLEQKNSSADKNLPCSYGNNQEDPEQEDEDKEQDGKTAELEIKISEADAFLDYLKR